MDRAGNILPLITQIQVLQDTGNPEITLNIDGYNELDSGVTYINYQANELSFIYADDLSGVDYIEYSINGGVISTFHNTIENIIPGNNILAFRAVFRKACAWPQRRDARI